MFLTRKKQRKIVKFAFGYYYKCWPSLWYEQCAQTPGNSLLPYLCRVRQIQNDHLYLKCRGSCVITTAKWEKTHRYTNLCFLLEKIVPRVLLAQTKAEKNKNGNFDFVISCFHLIMKNFISVRHSWTFYVPNKRSTTVDMPFLV